MLAPIKYYLDDKHDVDSNNIKKNTTSSMFGPLTTENEKQ